MPRRKPQKDTPQQKLAPEPLPEDEIGLFRRAVSGARPLTLDRVDLPRRRVRAKAHFSRLDERQALKESLEDPSHAVELENGSALFFRRSSVHPKVMRRLARGGVSVQGHLDLHGLTAVEAREALSDFIRLSLERGHTCVRVVHGKGRNSGQQGPVLKRKVDAWLRRWEPVLAFVSARQVDGGTGAVYVLLKK